MVCACEIEYARWPGIEDFRLAVRPNVSRAPLAGVDHASVHDRRIALKPVIFGNRLSAERVAGSGVLIVVRVHELNAIADVHFGDDGIVSRESALRRSLMWPKIDVHIDNQKPMRRPLVIPLVGAHRLRGDGQKGAKRREDKRRDAAPGNSRALEKTLDRLAIFLSGEIASTAKRPPKGDRNAFPGLPESKLLQNLGVPAWEGGWAGICEA